MVERQDMGVAASPPLSHPFGAEPVPVSGKAGIANAWRSTVEWIAYDEWRELRAESARLLTEAENLRRSGRPSAHIWDVLGPLNRRLRRVMVRGLDDLAPPPVRSRARRARR